MTDLIDVTCVVQPDIENISSEPFYAPRIISLRYDPISFAPPGYYVWDFGDGQDSAGQDLWALPHLYDCPGIYTVSLTVTTECGEGSITKPDFILIQDEFGDLDSDGDGWGDECDICPNVWNPSQDLAENNEWLELFPEANGFTNCSAVQQMFDGRYLIAGRPGDSPGCCFHLWCVDPCGDTVWDRPCQTHSCSQKAAARSPVDQSTSRADRSLWPHMEKCDDSGFVFVTNAGGNIHLMRFDKTAYYGWTRLIGDPLDLAYSVNQSPDGGFVIGAVSKTPGDGVKIIKTDAGGHTEWTDIIEELWPVGAFFVDLKPTSDGGYIYASDVYSTTTYDNNVIVAKLGANRSVDWQTTWDAGGDELATKVIETSDGGFVVGGWTRLPEEKFFLIRFDASGSLLWDRFYTVTNHSRCYDTRPTSDGGFLMVGTGVDSVEYERQFYVVKTDENGLLQWQQMFDGNDGDFAHTCAETFDGGFIIGGAAPDGSNNVGMVVKMMPPEHVSCCVGIRGNVDGDPGDAIDVSDLVMLCDYMFSGGAAPPCWAEANIDGSCCGPDGVPETQDDLCIADLVMLCNYMYSGGPAPEPCP